MLLLRNIFAPEKIGHQNAPYPKRLKLAIYKYVNKITCEYNFMRWRLKKKLGGGDEIFWGACAICPGKKIDTLV